MKPQLPAYCWCLLALAQLKPLWRQGYPMFNIPKPMKCPKCGTTGHFDSTVPCPKCLDEFIRQHVPVMVHDPDGKPYEPESQATLD